MPEDASRPAKFRGDTGKGADATARCARKTRDGGFVIAKVRPRCRRCRKPLGAADRVRCGSCGTRLDLSPEAARVGAPAVSDETRSPAIGKHRELSALTEVQKRILVAALHGDLQRSVRALCSGFREGIGIEAGGERFGGKEAVDSVTALLAAGYFVRTEAPYLGLTFSGQVLAEMARVRG